MTDKIIPFPLDSLTRLKNRLGKGAVPCMVSDFWLRFPAESEGHFEAGEFIILSVMRREDDEHHKKICELVVTREDLLAAIQGVHDPEKENA